MRFFLWLFIIFSPAARADLISESQDFLISDSLVKNLSCAKLSLNNVLQSLQPDAFDVGDHSWLEENWQSGILAQCWAMALSQREFFYYARFKAFTSFLSGDTSKLKKVFEMIRGANKEKNQVILFREKNMTDIEAVKFTIQKTEIDGQSFRSLIEQRQSERFFDPKNLKYIFDSAPRSSQENLDIMNMILKNQSEGRITALILRFSTNRQHAILAINAVPIDGLPNAYTIHVYDSNQSAKDVTIEFKNNAFNAQSIRAKLGSPDSDYPDIFITDEADMDLIQKNLYEYYKNLCRNQSGASALN